MKTHDSLLDSLLELQALDRVPRMGYLLRGVADPESVSEHSWQVVFLVWALADRVPGLDVRRALELALVHDLAELRLGDLPRTSSHYLPAGAKSGAELDAVEEMLAPLGERPRRLLAEYQAGETLEAKLVKACDKLQLMLKVHVYQRWGAGGLDEFWENPQNFPGEEIEAVAELFSELRARHSAEPSG